MVEDSGHDYLIVAGAYRAGTTSLFGSLAAHPQVAPSKIKEPGYFATPGLTPDGAYVLCGSTHFSSYEGLFTENREGEFRAEATAFYMFDQHALHRIHDELPRSKILIVLRDPVKRMMSWFQMLNMFRLLPSGTTFDDYVRMQLEDERAVSDRPMIMRCLEHGRYTSYLEQCKAVFGDDRMLVILLDDLIRDPKETLRKTATFSGIDPEFYDAYTPTRENAARALRREAYGDYYASLMALARRVAGHSRRGLPLLDRARAAVDPHLFRMMTRVADPISVAAQTEEFLRSYYAADTTALSELLHADIPWSVNPPSKTSSS